MGIQLKGIDANNWKDCIRLKLVEGQEKFVAPNWYSILEAHYDTSYVPLAIYEEDTVVGFFMYGKDPEDGMYWVVRLMVDQQHLGKGYGKQALLKGLELIKAKSDCSTEIAISYVPGNEAAEKLYESAGFVPTGRVIDGEIEARVKVS